MKIAVISDTHLGFALNSERANDSFNALEQAFHLAIQEQAELILMPGDLFDSSIPTQETWHQAFELFSLPRKARKSEIKLFKLKPEKKEIVFQGIPVIAIHGTHEFRSKEKSNALQILNSAQALIHFHAETLLIEKGLEKIAVHGLGGVPEKKAKEAIQLWNSKPIENAFNVFVFHQSLKEFLPFDDEMTASISLSDLPVGFDLYINGHLHWHAVHKLNKGLFFIPGSTIHTQMKKLEAEKPKGFVLFDTESNDLRFVSFPNQRKLFYHKLKFEKASLEEIALTVKEAIEKDLSSENFKLTPMIRLKLLGSLAKGVQQADIDLAPLLKLFQGKAIISLSKDFSLESFKKKILELRELQKNKASIINLGFNLLEKNLNETDFNEAFEVKQVFDLLSEDEIDKVIELLSQLKPQEKKLKEKVEQTKLV